jgi:hypothetical protein
MNLQAYANHRKALGLRGTSHVAVLNAINDGRLSAPAVQRQGRSWIIDPALADAQWASRTDPSERGAMGGGTARPIGTASAAVLSTDQPPAAAKGGPSLAISKQVKAAYEAKLTELEYKERSGEMGNLQDVKRQAAKLARQVRDLLLIIPSRNAARLAAMSDPEDVRSLLEEEIEGALKGLKNA